jgi:peptidoglycan/LPS O-acetylase OafA/YrhL
MSDEKKSINYKIQGLRAFFALNVIIWHIHWCIDPYTTRSLAVFFRGDLANVFFFFLSGYLLGRNYHLNDGFGKNWIYFLRRLISHLIHRGIYLLWIITTTFVAVASVFFSKYEGKINCQLPRKLTLALSFGT